MYSSLIIDRRIYASKKKGLAFNRLPRDKSIEITAKLERLRYDRDGKKLPDNQLVRALDDKERAFIESERNICKVDFEYWYVRYCKINLDPGVIDYQDNAGITESIVDGEIQKIGPPRLLESQKQYIHLFGRREEICHEEWKQYKFTLGILAVFHKARQVLATATAGAMKLHRMIFWPGTRAFAASIDAPRVTELFARDHLSLDNLPFWQMPAIYPDVKDTELGFASPVSSKCTYQAENQQAGGIGVGTQQDFSHLTEVSLWNYPGRIKFSFIPAIPKALTTVHIEESTADSKGYWYELTESVRHKREGYESWIYAFIPWWYNKLKYRDLPPPLWQPKEHTIKHAELIERTSPEFNNGIVYRPTIEQLYWWQTERARHVQQGELATFLTNYPATPEQSFQNPSKGALPVELLEEMEADSMMPGAHFDIELALQNQTA